MVVPVTQSAKRDRLRIFKSLGSITRKSSTQTSLESLHTSSRTGTRFLRNVWILKWSLDPFFRPPSMLGASYAVDVCEHYAPRLINKQMARFLAKSCEVSLRKDVNRDIVKWREMHSWVDRARNFIGESKAISSMIISSSIKPWI